MNLWVFLTIIIVAGILSEMMKHYFKYKSKATDALEPRMEAMNARHSEEIEALKQRVRNLEAIAAAAPEDFSGVDNVDFDTSDEEELNEKLINQLARKKTR